MGYKSSGDFHRRLRVICSNGRYCEVWPVIPATGQWNGKQILPAAWISQATSKQVSNGSDPDRDWDQGYGFQFWRCRHGAYRGDGKDGQFCIVLPELDAVIAITANTGDMQGELNIVWDKLLPALSDKLLEENSDEQAKLQAVIEKLKASR